MLYRDILMAACDAHGLRVVGVPERDVWHRTASALGLDVAVVQQRVVELGRQFGPPWAQDQKLAAAAAWLALTSVPAR